MKYSVELEVKLHRERVVELLTSHDNRRRWQNGFIGHAPLDGEPGTVGATTQLTFRVGEQQFEMIETILAKELPEMYCVSYVSSQSASISKNSFFETQNGTTLWRVDMQMRVNGLYKIMAYFSANGFRNQTKHLMRSFADYAER
ncbi:hypothetical protein NBRC116601_09470 [Cognatishimia sp. WU-CL00825]|uniref:SRPBCC family protein n=1 Tax=Cognatishimia sp. WU-CL00825 TaxID=3127658 RepID=UPI00310AA96F